MRLLSVECSVRDRQKWAGSAKGKFECGQQKYVFPLPFIDPICEIAVEWHVLIIALKIQQFLFEKDRTDLRHAWVS
jgi:hypothetical protein